MIWRTALPITTKTNRARSHGLTVTPLFFSAVMPRFVIFFANWFVCAAVFLYTIVCGYPTRRTTWAIELTNPHTHNVYTDIYLRTIY